MESVPKVGWRSLEVHESSAFYFVDAPSENVGFVVYLVKGGQGPDAGNGWTVLHTGDCILGPPRPPSTGNALANG
jgi:hypothetical protein